MELMEIDSEWDGVKLWLDLGVLIEEGLEKFVEKFLIFE